MIVFLITFIFSINTYAQLSFGDGSETCNWTTSDKSQRIYDCDSVTVGVGQTITFTGASDYIIIRSQGDVNIIGTLDISANGVSNGPGGGTGGTCPGAITCNGTNGSTKNSGEGIGGTAGTGIGGAGGGGSGARFGDTGLPSAGTNGANGGGGTAGIGALIPAAGYFLQSDFENNFTGGAGGGAGGSGEDFTPVYEPGGNGGAGAGGIIIIAKGSVNISGSILANGGNGLVGSNANTGSAGGGGGAGGSGGAIYIIGNAGVTITGTISALGGNGAAGGAGGVDSGGTGGNGGKGRVRIDTSAGSYIGVASNPVAYQTTLPTIIDPISNPTLDLKSDIEYSCAYKEGETFFIENFIMGLLLALVLLGIPKVLRRHQY